MSQTVQKWRHYVMTGCVKSIDPILIQTAKGATVTRNSVREYEDHFAGISMLKAGHCNPQVDSAGKVQLDNLVHCSSYLVAACPPRPMFIAPSKKPRCHLWSQVLITVPTRMMLTRKP